jgi:hypothetical protein
MATQLPQTKRSSFQATDFVLNRPPCPICACLDAAYIRGIVLPVYIRYQNHLLSVMPDNPVRHYVGTGDIKCTFLVDLL